MPQPYPGSYRNQPVVRVKAQALPVRSTGGRWLSDALVYVVMVWVLSTGVLSAQVPVGVEVRSVNGVGNNLTEPTWGASASWLINRCRVGFADGASEPAGAERPNARSVSNAVFAQEGDRFSESGLSDLWWAFGQLLDHDITLTHNDKREFMGVHVPMGDPDFDPDSTGAAMLPMMRSAAQMDETGVRRFANEISAFIDGSNVYGSDAYRADWLRSHSGGRLRVSAGNLPPFNTLNGEYGAPVDTLAPGMDGQRHPQQRLFVCGDVRANENSLLTSLHALWVREHNRLADSLTAAYPSAGDEAVYQHARRLVSAQLQHITYAEWLPTIGIELASYTGYDPNIDAGISNEFAAAAFRFGHTLVGSELWLMDANGQQLSNSPLQLRDVFFDPVAVVQRDGVAPLLSGAGHHRQQAMDTRVVTDLRSFLFGAPGQGGLDLAAINIQRGRDRGVASFNDVRRDLDLAPYENFAALTLNDDAASDLASVYANVDALDAWVGLLAEAKRGDAQVGETLALLLSEQFERTRAGDRLWYAADAALSGAERAWVERQSLAQVIERNTTARLGAQAFVVPDDASATYAAGSISGEVTVRYAEGQVWIGSLVPGETATLLIHDMLGRELAQAEVRADGFGESRVLLNVENARSVVCSIHRADVDVQSSLVVVP